MTAAPETEVLQSVFKPTVPLTQYFIKSVMSEAAQKRLQMKMGHRPNESEQTPAGSEWRQQRCCAS